MASRFAAFARAASRQQDRHFAEGFRWEPRTAPAPAPAARPDVNARSIADPARDPAGTGVVFRAVFVAPGAMMNAHGRAMSDASTKAIGAEKPHLDCAMDALGGARPQQNDRIVWIDEGRAFLVTQVLDIDYGRLAIHLAEIR